MNKRDRVEGGGGGTLQYVRGKYYSLKGTNLTVVAIRHPFISPALYKVYVSIPVVRNNRFRLAVPILYRTGMLWKFLSVLICFNDRF